MEQTKTISVLSFIADCFFAAQFALLFVNLLAVERTAETAHKTEENLCREQETKPIY